MENAKAIQAVVVGEPNKTALIGPDPLAGLRANEKKFVIAYARTNSLGQSAIIAGYSPKSAYSQGSRMLKTAKIARAVNAYCELHVMGYGEAYNRLSSYARGNIEVFLGDNGEIILDKEIVGEHLHLIKSVKRKEENRSFKVGDSFETVQTITLEITLYDAKDAVEKILQVHGKLKQATGDNNNQPKKQQSYKLPDGTLITW